jgi:hypothetical protein
LPGVTVSPKSTKLVLFISVAALCLGMATQAGASVTVNKGAKTVLGSHAATGTWGTAEEIPGTAGLNAGGDDELDGISCPSPGNCSGGGVYTDAAGNEQLFVVDETNGSWGSAVEIPGFAILNAGTKANFWSISCSSAGNCSAVGSYTDETGATQAFVVSEAGGTWGSAIEAPGIPHLNFGGSLTAAVSCPSDGNCSAGGTYLDGSDHLQAFVISETSGSWGTAVAIPGVVALNVGGFATLIGISCASAGNCSATGGYTDGGSHIQGFVVDETGGTWGTAIAIPGLAALGATSPNSISCSSAGNCGVGGFYADASAHDQAFVANEVNGTWGSATELAGSATLNAGGSAEVSSISCKASGACAAVGSYTDGSTHLQGFVADEAGGSWGSAQPVQGLATLNVGGAAALTSVSCTAPGDCDAVGGYDDTTTSSEAVYVDEVNGAWGEATEVPGTAVLNVAGGAVSLTTSCSTYGNCSEGGYYADGAGNFQAFVVGETFTKAENKIHVTVTQTTKVIKKKVTETALKLSATGLGTATGSVVFSSNKGSLCTATISNGSAKCSSSKRFAKGSLTVTAKYAGDAYDQSSVATSKVSVK